MTVPVERTRDERRRAKWTVVELVDSRELAHEGRTMRHCVARYARACAAGHSSIWSVRHRWDDEVTARSMLTIEVRPDTRTIVQLRGKSNQRASGWPLELVRRWAAREGLSLHHSLGVAAAYGEL